MSIALGNASEEDNYHAWPVLRDGEDTGLAVVHFAAGYGLVVPSKYATPGVPEKWPYRVSRGEALEDAEQWFKEKEKNA